MDGIPDGYRNSGVKLRLVAVGTRLPDWVSAGFAEYARRLPRTMPLQLFEVPAANRRNQGLAQIRATEAAKLLAQVGGDDWVVALDVEGKTCSTEKLAEKLDGWRMRGSDVTFLVGGADGLAEDCLTRANETISLSAFTFPHALVRVILAEQLYRAWTLLTSHPYHRA